LKEPTDCSHPKPELIKRTPDKTTCTIDIVDFIEGNTDIMTRTIDIPKWIDKMTCTIEIPK